MAYHEDDSLFNITEELIVTISGSKWHGDLLNSVDACVQTRVFKEPGKQRFYIFIEPSKTIIHIIAK